MLDNSKKSPLCIFSIVIPIVGKALPTLTEVLAAPVKKLFINVTDFCDVPDAIALIGVSVLLSKLAE